MLKTKVFARSLTNLTDARYFAAWEAEWLAFNLDVGAEDHITPQNVIALKEWVDGVKIVAEFGPLHSAADIRAANKLIEPDAVLLHMLTERETAAELEEISLIKEIVVDKDTDESTLAAHLSEFASVCDTFLLNFAKGGISWAQIQSDEGISCAFLKELCQEFPCIVEIDFSGEMIENFLEEIYPLGISVRGGEEEKVGFKSFDETDEIFEAIEIFR